MKLLNREQWLFCLRGGLSMMIAYLVTHGSEPYNAIYAVMGAGLVTAPSVGEGIGISKDRLVGTLLGVIVSIPASWLGHPLAALAASVCIVMPLGIILGGIPVGRIALTVASVAVVLHPGSVEHYGFLRFTNTMAGVVTAVAVSFAFWPLCGRFSFSDSIRSALAACATLADRLATSDPDASLIDEQRALFGILAALPKTAGHARLDPLLYRHHTRIRTETQLVAKIGISLLWISLARSVAPCAAEERTVVCAHYRRMATRFTEARLAYGGGKPPGCASASGAAPGPNVLPEADASIQVLSIMDEMAAIDRWLDELQALQRVRK
jgi:uncharacterized membrane protein YccC